ncbi:unnamed protein product, partial [Tetraodon nigroviridis]
VPGGQYLFRLPTGDHLLGVQGQGQELPSSGPPHPAGVLQGTRQTLVQHRRQSLPCERPPAPEPVREAVHRGVPGQHDRGPLHALQQPARPAAEKSRGRFHQGGRGRGAGSLPPSLRPSVCVCLKEVLLFSPTQAVWFGCDVDKHFHGKLGINDMNVFNHELVFGISVKNLTKAERLIYGDSLMTHAMILTAVTDK